MIILRSLKKIVVPLLLILTLVFVIRILLDYSEQLPQIIQSINTIYVTAGLLCYLLYFYLRALSFHFLTKLNTEKIQFIITFKIWFLSELVRYVPGNVWSFATRFYFGKKDGLSKTSISVSIIIEIAFLLFITIIFSLPFLFGGFSNLGIEIRNLIFTFVAVIFGVVLLPLFIKNKLIHKYSSLIDLSVFLKSSNFYTGFIFQVLAWFFFGIGSYFLIYPFFNQLPFVFIFSLSLFAWLFGYMSFITPMGLGIREGMLIFVLSQFGGIAEATIVAILSRIVLIVTETLNGSFWILLFYRKLFKITFAYLSKRWDLILLGIFIATYIITLSSLSVLRHNAFASSFDLGNMDNTIWNTLHGNFFAMSTEVEGEPSFVSRIATHTDFILVLLTPLYLIWEDVRILLISETVALGLGAIPTYFIGLRILKSKFQALVISFVYLLNPGMQWTDIYDFHGVSFAIPFILTAFYFILTKNWKWFFVFYFLAIITKEQISLLLAMLGIYIFIFYKERFIGSFATIFGLLWFFVMIFIVMPIFSGGNEHWAFKNWFAKSRDELLIEESLYSKVLYLFREITIQGPEYFLTITKNFGYIPLLGFPFLLLGVPDVLINLLSSHDAMRSIRLHYDSGVTPFLVLATIYGIYFVKKIFESIKITAPFAGLFSILLVFYLLIAALRVNYIYSPLPTTPSCWCLIYQVSEEDKAFEKVLQAIPESASVTASSEVRPHLTHRKEIFNLPAFPKEVDYVALIDQDRSVGGYNPHPYELGLIESWKNGSNPSFSQSTYSLEFQEGHFYLYKRIR